MSEQDRLRQLGKRAHWQCGRCDQESRSARGEEVGEEIPLHFDGCPLAKTARLEKLIAEARIAALENRSGHEIFLILDRRS